MCVCGTLVRMDTLQHVYGENVHGERENITRNVRLQV